MLTVFFSGNVKAQNPATLPGASGKPFGVVQVTGLVVAGKQQFGVPGVYFYVPKAGRGAISNEVGFFSIATAAGDSAIVSAIGYKRQFYKVPNDGRQSISVIIYLQEDTLFTPVVEVTPYSTEELFKQAFLAINLEDGEYSNMRRSLSPKIIAKIANSMPMDGSQNFKMYMREYQTAGYSKVFAPSIQLTNPFAWVNFIKSVRRGDLKRRDYRRELEEQETEDRRKRIEEATKPQLSE